ncbi:hypothetical protein ACJVC5_18885 [Peredibacter sp. HCB2-198]|uniref:hypothetical protein n=1 Tax=Peredibacter sp. HCB2-198 TaxID=3383025 RepID=UPI0038B4C53F
MKQSLILIALLFMTISCSQKGTNVALKVSHNFVMSGSLSAISGGGLIIWGQSETGKSFAHRLQDADEIKLSLENGTWTFYAMAWDGSLEYSGTSNPSNSTPFGGVARCGKSSPTILGGEPTAIDLSITNPNCMDSIFAGTPGMNGNKLPSIKMQFCSNLASISGNTDICSDNSTVANRKSFKAPIGSYRFKALAENGAIEGSCISATNTVEQPGLPAGGQNLPFKFVMEMFPGSNDCDTSTGRRGAEIIQYPNGVSAAPSVSTKVYNGAYKYHHFIEVTPTQICLGRDGTNLEDHPFAAGTGLASHPFVICSVPQWYKINAVAAFASSYKLQSDLDFNKYSIGLGQELLDQAACLELGTNFIPVGYPYATCSGSDIIWDNINTFLGNFYGSGFSMKNLRLRDKDRSHLGIFAHIQGTGIYIGDFNLERPEIEGRFRVGAIAGEATGSAGASSLLFNNIKLGQAEIQGRPENGDNVGATDVGGLIGYLNFGTVKQVSVLNSKVRGDSSRVGGVIGYLYNGEMSKIISEVDVEARSGQTILNVGGVAGLVDNALLNWVKHEGEVRTDGKQVGGIAGSSSNSSITNFYTISNINLNSSDLYNYAGGVIGYWTGSGNLAGGYSLANVQTGCTTGCKQGSIVGYAESGTPNILSAVYNLGPAESGEQATNVTGPFVSRSIADIRSSSMMTTLVDITSDDWKIVNGVYPRFDFEYHPCSSGSLGAGAGTETSPRYICNEMEYQDLAPSTLRLKLLANIRLSNTSTLAYDIPSFKAYLDGNNRALIGGHSNFTGGAGTAHIDFLYGEIKNLRIQGMSRTSMATNDVSNPGSVLVRQNMGNLLNLDVSVRGKFNVHASGLVGRNAGLIQNIKFDGNIEGNNNMSTFVSINQTNGKIYDSRVGGSLRCSTSACSGFAGISTQNSGEIARINMSVHFRDDSGFVTDTLSMLVDTNMNKMTDISVPSHVEFRTNGGDTYYYTRYNSGTLQRVVNLGRLLSNNTSTAPLLNFPGDGNLIAGSGGGTHIDVKRGGISGKMLLQETPYTCTSGNMLNVPAWSGLTSWASFSSSYNSLSIYDKELVIIFTPDGQTPRYHHVINIAGPDFTIPTSACSTSGKVSVYLTDDVYVVPGSATPATNVLLPQNLNDLSSFSTAWRSIMWDMNNADDEQKMLDYHAYKMGLTTTPVTRAVWELGDEGPRLFED